MYKCPVCKTLHNIFFTGPLDYKDIDAFNKQLKYDNECLAPDKDLTKSSQFRAVVSGMAFRERAERLGLIGKTTTTATASAKPQPEPDLRRAAPRKEKTKLTDVEEDLVGVYQAEPFNLSKAGATARVLSQRKPAPVAATVQPQPQPQQPEPVSKPVQEPEPEWNKAVQSPFTREYYDPEFGPSVIKKRR
jgi:hypothetical protein